MKTPPVPQKKPVPQAQPQPDGSQAEGKSMAPPAFQLKADPQAAGANQQNAADTAPELLTITDPNAMLRDSNAAFKSLGTKIPQGTRVEVIEEKVVAGKTYIKVRDHDGGAELGWTSKGNSTNLDKKYKAAGASYTYHVGGHDLVVYVPKAGLKTTTPNVFMFFHGRGGDYATSKTHAKNGGFEDNPALASNMASTVEQTGGIAICPQGHGFKVDQDWGAQGAGKFKAMLDMALTRLSADLGTETPLAAGNVSLAGHSAGGNALGQAALDTGATDVTLQEAGYGFDKSWIKLRDWFMTGQTPKTMRVITQNNGNGAATRKLLNKGAAFDKAQIIAYSKLLAKGGQLDGPVTVEEFQGDGKVEDGKMVMERGYRVLRSDGSLMGSVRLYHHENEKADHWAVASDSMGASMTSGAKDRAADAKAMAGKK